MKLASAALVAFMTLDFMQSLPAAPVQEPQTKAYETGNGELLVNVSSAALTGSAPRGATRVELATLNLSASCDSDITVENIVITHTGLGAAADITAVYLSSGYRRLSRARRFDNSSQRADLRIPLLVIPKCGAKRLQVLVDLSQNAAVASEHGVTVAAAADVVSSAKRVTLTQGDDTRKVVASPKQAGAITVNFLPIKGPLRYGRTETVARVQFTADGKNDHLLREITFTNAGSARDMNLINFQLETRSGKALTRVAQRMRGKEVTLTFDPTYILERNQTMVFLLKAQINGSRNNTVEFGLEEPADLDAVLHRPSR